MFLLFCIDGVFFSVDKSSLLCRPNKNTPFQICIFLNLRFSENKEFVIEFHISIQIIFNGILIKKTLSHTGDMRKGKIQNKNSPKK